jgi:hypothetical protein
MEQKNLYEDNNCRDVTYLSSIDENVWEEMTRSWRRGTLMILDLLFGLQL